MHCGFLSKAILRLVFEFFYFFIFCRQMHNILIHTPCYSSPDLNLRGFVVKCGFCCLRVTAILGVIDKNASPL